MTMSNTITAHDGQEIYLNRILEVTDEFLSDEKDIYNISVFRALLKEIYRQIFRPIEPRRYTSQSNLDFSDIQLLDDIWEIYCTLCYRYHHRPTILRFCTMIGISRETIDHWRRGITRGASSEYVDTVKRWLTECESSLEDGAIESNSIGCIFALKSNYQWRETAPISELPTDYGRASRSPEEIRRKYEGTEKPELPDFEIV